MHPGHVMRESHTKADVGGFGVKRKRGVVATRQPAVPWCLYVAFLWCIIIQAESHKEVCYGRLYELQLSNAEFQSVRFLRIRINYSRPCI